MLFAARDTLRSFAFDSATNVCRKKAAARDAVIAPHPQDGVEAERADHGIGAAVAGLTSPTRIGSTRPMAKTCTITTTSGTGTSRVR